MRESVCVCVRENYRGGVCVYVRACTCVCVCYREGEGERGRERERERILKTKHYGVATISRLLKIICLFCKRAISKRLYSAKET